MDFFSLIGSVLSGGATGLLGVVFGKVADYFKLKQELEVVRENHKHDVEMKNADAAIMREEWAQRTKIAQIEGEAKVGAADAEAFGKSFSMEPTRYSEGMKPAEGGKWAKAFQNFGWFTMVLVDAVRAVVRPGLTLYLAWITTQMYERAGATLAVIQTDPLAHAAAMDSVYQQIVYTLLYLFTTCVTWWFGTRNQQKPPKVG